MNSISDNSAWKPGTGSTALKARSGLLARIREFFSARGILEVETPVLSSAGNSDPGIEQFSTSASSMWLRTSPEYAMKRLLAAGSGDIYELGRVFRRGESGRNHNVEFTMLEWYRRDWNYHQLMDEVVELVRYCLPAHSLRESRVSYRQWFAGYTGLDPLAVTNQELEEFIAAQNLSISRLSRAEMLDLIISHFIQAALPADGLTLVYDYPAGQAALARIRQDDPPVAERFELFLGQTELANGYQELTDPKEQEIRFRQENKQRLKYGDAEVPIDENLLDALRSGLPECAGVALGFDRLLMYQLGASSLAEVMAFPDSTA